MRQVEGDLWTFLGHCWLVIPTNIGWRPKPDEEDPTAPCGPAPMGAGVAGQFAERVPSAPYLWGMFCHHHKALTPVLAAPQGWIYFPTKALDEKRPWLSWKAKANLVLVERSLAQLAALRLPSKEERVGYARAATFETDEVAIPMVGCGEGRLKESQVLPLMKQYLDDRFILVRQPPSSTPEKVHPF